MIKCKIVEHYTARTVHYGCSKCGRINMRSFNVEIPKEYRARDCWNCSTPQPAILRIIFDRNERIEYYKSKRQELNIAKM